MSEPISAFDGNYVRLGPVAALLAQERPQCAADDVMELLKRAVFAGEFEPPSFEVGETREEPRTGCIWRSRLRDACCRQIRLRYRSAHQDVVRRHPSLTFW
jgi:hypothetical protein